MYYLFLDESGDDGDYYNPQGQVIKGSSKWITVAGIAVEDTDIIDFQWSYDSILDRYFIQKGITLPPNFKLHYAELKRNKPPYDQLHFDDRCALVHEMFSTVTQNNCQLISCSIDIANHCSKYAYPVNPKAYALLICYERFEYFKQQFNTTGKVIYEEFNHERKRINKALKDLLSYNAFPNPTQLQSFGQNITSGKPCQYPVLQFSDFIANCAWLHVEKQNQLNDRFPLLIPKYYNFNTIQQYAGYVEI